MMGINEERGACGPSGTVHDSNCILGLVFLSLCGLGLLGEVVADLGVENDQ